jgi:hypothetical protein
VCSLVKAFNRLAGLKAILIDEAPCSVHYPSWFLPLGGSILIYDGLIVKRCPLQFLQSVHDIIEVVKRLAFKPFLVAALKKVPRCEHVVGKSGCVDI